MDLARWIWEERITNVALAKKIGCTKDAIGKMKRKEHTPMAWVIVRLLEVSNGKITIQELLSEKDEKEYKKWLSKKNKKV